MPATVRRAVADGMTILGLPGKICNANTKAATIVAAFAFMHRIALAGVYRVPTDSATILGLSM